MDLRAEIIRLAHAHPEHQESFLNLLTPKRSSSLGFTYKAVAAMLDDLGWSEKKIGDFLKKHQNESGYIHSSKLPGPLKGKKKASEEKEAKFEKGKSVDVGKWLKDNGHAEAAAAWEKYEGTMGKEASREKKLKLRLKVGDSLLEITGMKVLDTKEKFSKNAQSTYYAELWGYADGVEFNQNFKFAHRGGKWSVTQRSNVKGVSGKDGKTVASITDKADSQLIKAITPMLRSQRKQAGSQFGVEVFKALVDMKKVRAARQAFYKLQKEGDPEPLSILSKIQMKLIEELEPSNSAVPSAVRSLNNILYKLNAGSVHDLRKLANFLGIKVDFSRLAQDKVARYEISEAEFDRLKSKDRVEMAYGSVMSAGSGDRPREFIVGRKSHAKRYNVTSKVLIPVVDGQPRKGGMKIRLLKRANGNVSLALGDMAGIIQSFRKL